MAILIIVSSGILLGFIGYFTYCHYASKRIVRDNKEPSSNE
jgi:hypothetical protein